MFSLEKVGRRFYVTGGDTYPIKDKLSLAGCTWDRDRRQWWIGAAKVAAVRTIISETGEAVKPGETSVPDNTRILGKASYKGHTYYSPWFGVTKSGEKKARLVTLDGKVDFWAILGDGPDQARIVKTYEPRTFTFRGRSETRYTTLGSLRSFIEQERENRRSGGEVCAACGKSGQLVRDLEDGAMKHPRCCDIEP